MASTHFQRIGIGANLSKEPAAAILAGLVSSLSANGFDLYLDDGIADVLPEEKRHNATVGFCNDCDVFIAVGGDGTILRFARQLDVAQTPILGLNAGQLGFLTEGRIDGIAERLRAGRFAIQRRMRIQAEVRTDERVLQTFTALNDIVVHGAGFSRMVKMRTEVDGSVMREYRADGIIVATPTGSTAYSLSAGGPLLAPEVRAIILTPLSPHMLSVRPLVVDSEQVVSLHVVAGRSRIVVTIDGQDGYELEAGQYLQVRKSPRYTHLVVPDDYDFFALLREKL
jgi:NAD+ kinase